ncbi:MAG TPA: hypothetical protein VF808_13385 [Ktedonobacterales bacterium]
MTDRTERQERDEATDARAALNEATGQVPSAADQTVGPEAIAPETREHEATPATPRAPKTRRAPRKSAGKSARARKPTVDPEAARAAEEADRARAVIELESKGFSEIEALRLIGISKRLENSAEARQARRLRFTRWLVEQGILDEFSA